MQTNIETALYEVHKINSQNKTPLVTEPSKPELYYQSVASGMVHGVTCLLLLVATFAHRGMSQPLGTVIDGILGQETVARVQEALGEMQLDTLVS
jgi:hypothetical protein